MKGAVFTPAEQVEVTAPAPAPAAKKPSKKPSKKQVRAREADGQFKADNPATTDVDEAWEEAKE